MKRQYVLQHGQTTNKLCLTQKVVYCRISLTHNVHTDTPIETENRLGVAWGAGRMGVTGMDIRFPFGMIKMLWSQIVVLVA